MGREVTNVRPLRETSPAVISIFLNASAWLEAEKDWLGTKFDAERVENLSLHKVFERQEFRARGLSAIDESQSMFR
jgi:hypothetical protein